jgi:Zn-dependent M28 family amino/carboxypeptidase
MRAAIFLMVAVWALIPACTAQKGAKDAENSINQTDLERHIVALASDGFQGRKPFTPGETKTVEYLAAAFQQMGLEPGNGDSYYQDVPLVEIDGEFSDYMVMTTAAGAGVTLGRMQDYIASTRRIVETVTIKNSPLVFAGYGIVAPEYNWNDYKGLDVTGKTVLVLVNDPGYATRDELLFKGNTMTYYGRWTYKYEEAARQGATGVVVVHETGAAGYPWTVLQNGAAGADLVLQTPDKNASMCALEGWITAEAARKLFTETGYDFDKACAAAAKAGFEAIDLKAQVSLKITNKLTFNNSKNVVARIPGTTRPDECIVYTSHWDHLGFGPVVDGDSIYNGAADNAIPLACMLETAKAFSRLDPGPERTILFVAVTAEETGLLGSAWYVEHPVVPLDKTVANLNYELFLPLGPMNDVTVYGYGQSELDDYIAHAAAEQDRYVMPEQNPERGMYFRTDHFSFAKKGVPAAFFKGWSDHAVFGRQWTAEQIADFWSNHYHRPTDEYDPETADLTGIVDDAKLFFKIGYKLSTETTFPQWNDGSEFKKIREGAAD